MDDAGHGPTTACPRCGLQAPADADACSKCGGFLPGNQVARQSGIYARLHPPDLRMTADTLLRGIVADKGGEAEMSTLELSYVRKLTDLEIVIRLMTSDIARRGLLTPAGNVRNVSDKLMTALSVFDRYASRIGLERKPRPVPSLAEYLERRAAEKAQQAPQTVTDVPISLSAEDDPREDR